MFVHVNRLYSPEQSTGKNYVRKSVKYFYFIHQEKRVEKIKRFILTVNQLKSFSNWNRSNGFQLFETTIVAGTFETKAFFCTNIEVTQCF